MQTPPLPIDFAALIELMGGNHDGVRSLLALFVDELSADLNASTIAIEANDRVSLQQIAHRLKGTSANLTAPMLSAVASELEQSCKETDDAQLLANHRQMIEQATLLREAIAYWLDSASPTNESETDLSS
ncbi:MAG: Hpt domain-containing protein [Halieaceae bacterium]|nr:Hpt domain-containing protein [Halieaceae bacterium]